jgi:hypothetical protein
MFKFPEQNISVRNRRNLNYNFREQFLVYSKYPQHMNFLNRLHNAAQIEEI